MNAIELPNGAKIGAWLENALTEEGIEGVRDAIIGGLARRRGNSHVLSLWAQWYPEVLDGVPLHLDTKTDTFVPVVIVMDEDQADTPSYFRGVQKLVRVELRGEGACLVSEAIGDIAGKSWTCNSRHDAAYVVLPDDAKLEAALANFEVEE